MVTFYPLKALKLRNPKLAHSASHANYTRVKLILVPQHVLVALVKVSHGNQRPPKMAETKSSYNEDQDGFLIA